MLIYICDDSKSDCLRLMHHLSAYENEIGADFSTVAFSSGDEMFSYLKKHREIPDLFFLDIYMEEKTAWKSPGAPQAAGDKRHYLYYLFYRACHGQL